LDVILMYVEEHRTPKKYLLFNTKQLQNTSSYITTETQHKLYILLLTMKNIVLYLAKIE
jgi:hypothetical protein